MVPAHGQPLYGAERTEEVLRMYRDGIQFVHDQTIRYMNHGLTPDELANTVKLPPHLDGFTPYLRQYYGTVKHSVRQIYQGYLGWFDGDPVELDPIPRAEAARRRIALMGGRDKVLGEAQKAIASKDAQWAAELATDLIRANTNDSDARQLKARAFRTLGYAQMNINWRNWYLVSAHELDGSLDPAAFTRRITASFAAPDIIAAMPARVWVESFTTRLKAESTLDLHQSVGFTFPDVKERYALELRRGIVQFHEHPPANLDVEITMDKGTLNEVLLGKTKFPEAVIAGKIKLAKGTPQQLQQFFAYFEQPGESPIALTVR
jgi:alkyl sulfatase BDS1-like metallo-beta-lactamase superfamily hydrolase